MTWLRYQEKWTLATSWFQDKIRNELTLMEYEFVNDYLRKSWWAKF